MTHAQKITPRSEKNILFLNKGIERYIFIFDDANKQNVLRKLGDFATRPELSFSWYDAAILSQQVNNK